MRIYKKLITPLFKKIIISKNIFFKMGNKHCCSNDTPKNCCLDQDKSEIMYTSTEGNKLTKSEQNLVGGINVDE